MTRMVTVLVLPPGSAAVRTEKIDGDDYTELRRLVDGNLGSCPLPPTLRDMNFYAFCDDDALIREDRPERNRFAEHLGHAHLAGPIVIVRTDYTGETLGLRPNDIAALELYLVQAPPAEALRRAEQERQFWRDHPSGFAILNNDTGAWESQ
jgi:hypothetical protein